MTLNGVMVIILRNFADLGSFRGQLRTRSSSEDKIANVNFFTTTYRRRTIEYNRLGHKIRTDIGHTVFTVNRKPSITTRNHHNGKAKLKRYVTSK